jgi:hypothetical protein
MLSHRKAILSRIAAVAIAALGLALSVPHIAYAISTSTEVAHGYEEALTLARQRMETAVQPGAFGHGVPIIKDIPYLMHILPWIGLALGVAIAAVVATKFLVSKMRYATVTAAH